MNNKQYDTGKPEQTEPDLDAAVEALQAVVMAQKAQIDALLASLEGLLTALSKPTSSLSPVSSPSQIVPLQLAQPPAPAEQTFDSALLGNPQDPQFTSLHQLMGRLKAA